MNEQVRTPNSQNELKSLVVTYGEFGKLFKCSRSHIHKQVKSGKIPVIFLGGKRLIARKVVDQLLAGAALVAEDEPAPAVCPPEPLPDVTPSNAPQDIVDAMVWTVRATRDLATVGPTMRGVVGE
jgi:excisionase family DNA binding protein